MKHITKHKYQVGQFLTSGHVGYKIIYIDYVYELMEVETTNPSNIAMFDQQFKYEISFAEADDLLKIL